MSKETSSYALRLPKSLKKAVERLSKEDGASINQFVASAVAVQMAPGALRNFWMSPALAMVMFPFTI